MSAEPKVSLIEPFGAEVDLDISEGISPETYGVLRRLFAEHHMLVLKRQNISLNEQVRFAKQFGPVVPVDGLNFGILVSNNRPEGNFGLKDVNGSLCFHHDNPFAPQPDRGILFYALDVVNGASSTRFASGALAYDRLPEATKTRLAGLQTLNVFSQEPEGRNRNDQVPPYFPRAIHPLVWKHRDTGRPFLFNCSQSTDCILGMPADESEALLQELWQVQFAEDMIYDHVWEAGDVVLIDNEVLQHGRSVLNNVGNRTLRRVTIADKSSADMFPEFDVSAILGTGEKPAVGLTEGYQRDLQSS